VFLQPIQVKGSFEPGKINRRTTLIIDVRVSRVIRAELRLKLFKQTRYVKPPAFLFSLIPCIVITSLSISVNTAFEFSQTFSIKYLTLH